MSSTRSCIRARYANRRHPVISASSSGRHDRFHFRTRINRAVHISVCSKSKIGQLSLSRATDAVRVLSAPLCRRGTSRHPHRNIINLWCEGSLQLCFDDKHAHCGMLLLQLHESAELPSNSGRMLQRNYQRNELNERSY